MRRCVEPACFPSKDFGMGGEDLIATHRNVIVRREICSSQWIQISNWWSSQSIPGGCFWKRMWLGLSFLPLFAEVRRRNTWLSFCKKLGRLTDMGYSTPILQGMKRKAARCQSVLAFSHETIEEWSQELFEGEKSKPFVWQCKIICHACN